jgi:large repetitive protein
VVKSEYDAAGNRTKMTDAENQDTTYAYDSLNRVAQIDAFNGQQYVFTYDTLGRRTNLNRPGTVPWESVYTYNTRSQLTAIEDKSAGTTYDSWTYTYDNVGNRASATRLGQPAISYGYDLIYQLTSAGASSYSYDKVGNRLSAPTGVATYNYSNQILTRDLWSYTHDNNGNRIQADLSGDPTAKNTDEWDYENRLMAIRDANGNLIASYKYDPFGKRIYRQST